MDNVVTRFYESMNEDELSKLTNKKVMSFLKEDELEVLSSQYWMFDVNVPSIVSVMRDARQKIIPYWIEKTGFKKTEIIVKNEHNSYEVWQKEFSAGRVELGMNGFDGHGRHYFVSVLPLNKNDELELNNFYPANQYVAEMKVGAFTYHDWDELILIEVPESLLGGKLLTTIRGRAREAHLVNAFRKTKFPSSEKPDQIMLTWSKDPKTTQSIQWRTSSKIKKGVVRYWENGNDEKDAIEINAEKNILEDRLLQNDRYVNRYTAVIEKLEQGTPYNYKVGDPGTNNWSEIAEFLTAPSSSDPFSFVYFGDTHKSPHWGELINKAYKRFPEAAFYSIGGDMVSTGLHRNDWDQLFEYSSDVIKNRPLMSTLGNHDDQNGLGAWMYTDLFDLPKNSPKNLPEEYTYSFKYGDALFLMLAATLPIKEQTAWLEDQLENSNEKWKVAMFHFPPYSYEEDYSVIRKEWGTLFDKYHVDLVFSGHVHYYMRSKPMYDEKPVKDPADGTIYVISIAVPNKDRPMSEEKFVDVRFAGEHLYQKIDINGDELLFNAYNIDGKVLDSFKINKGSK
ncbi:MAG: metallophosphoesterase family protein [Ignavibacteriae bacterium]|nr:metallophosphoesterase family protein [Ignavibacteriota bacterium]